MAFDELPNIETVEKTMNALKKRGVEAELVKNRNEALERLKELIPTGSEIMTGASTTLQEIGFISILESKNHDWNNLKDAIVGEKDAARQHMLRAESVTSDYFLGSFHAISEKGEILIASATGSQIPSYAFSSDNVIWVAGTQKIVANLDEAFARLKEYVYPLEDKRMKSTGAQGTAIGKILIFEREIMPNRKINLIFVNEKLGY